MSVLKSIASPARSRIFLAMMSALLMVAGMLFGANVAAADSVQVQSFQRASQTATCDSPPESMTEWRASWANPSDPISGPTWHPSWERWANKGNGGWTCTRSITWARTPAAASGGSSGGGGGSVTYAVGDIGPGGGLVFLISGGKTYEMAPKTWWFGVDAMEDWCSDLTNSVATGTGVGTGSANTTAMLTNAPPFVACTLSAANYMRAYPGTDSSVGQWFLPSQDELNAMCNYSRNPTAPPTGTCTGPQNPDFASSAYGFVGSNYWSSSQYSATFAWYQEMAGGVQKSDGYKDFALRVRPVRAF